MLLKLDTDKRNDLVKEKKICFNFLGSHNVKNCQSLRRCVKCGNVLDASSKNGKNDLSLNDCLHEGKKFLCYFLGVLLRFRTGKFAMTSDIAKAFLQLELNPRDRDAVRFFLV